MSGTGVGALAGGLVCLVASPYLARITLTAGDRENPRWWRGAAPSRGRLLVTTATAVVLGVLSGIAAHWSVLLPAFLALALLGTPLTVIDFEHHRLPNRLTYASAVAAAVLFAVAALVRHDWSDYLRALEAGIAVYAVLFVVYFVGTFGLGDVKFGGVLGAYLGWRDWVTVYYGIFAGFVLGSVVAIGLLLARKATRKTPLAFGPMLLLGALLVLAFDLTPTLTQ